MNSKLLHFSHYQWMNWKNGGGQTAQIAIFPPSASLERMDFIWRLSTATIQKSGPFSTFPGCDRLLAHWKGGAMELIQKERNESILLKPRSSIHFEGEEVVDCVLREGEASDLGLIYKRDLVQARMVVIPFSTKVRSFESSAPTTFYFTLSGSFHVSVYPNEEKHELDLGDALQIQRGQGLMSHEKILALFEPQETKSCLVGIEIVHVSEKESF